MFQPEEVERDKYGFWYHSALKESQEEDITKVEGAEGMEFKFVSFESDASDELQGLYERGSTLNVNDTSADGWVDAVRAWEPTKPEGDGWFLFAIYDTDDGPHACFTRPKIESLAGDAR